MEVLSWYRWWPIDKYVVSLLIVTGVFLVYLLIQQQIEKWGKTGIQKQAKSIIINRLAGFLLFGPIAYILYKLSGEFCLCSLGVYFKFKPEVWLVTALLSITTVITNWFIARSASNLSMYPQIRLNEWSIKLLITSSLTLVMFIISFEFLFRSLLLFSWLNALGAPAAIALNICIYALIHLPKGKNEVLRSIPMGLILCLLVLSMHSFWPAVFVHASLSLSNEWFSFHFQPNMYIKQEQTKEKI